MVIEIPLGRSGRTALIDAIDAERVLTHRWSLVVPSRNRTGYARRSVQVNDGGRLIQRSIYLHRLICGAFPGQLVDHIDGNGLNNRRSNLRLCTATENNHNRRKVACETTSRFKGVVLYRGAWHAILKLDGRQIQIRCASEVAAAERYDELVREHRGSFAFTNFKGPDSGN